MRAALWTRASPSVTTTRAPATWIPAAAPVSLLRRTRPEEPRAVAQRITLYGPRHTPYTEKVRRALVLKGLDFELREPTGPEDFQRWSPETGLLPVLTLDSELVSDSTAILLRLDELYPKPPLLASDPVIAAQQRQLEDWADESFLWYWNRWLVLAQRREAADAT